MLDIHTHILPGVDDGSKDVQQSISMLRCEARQGVHTVVMTPHYSARKESPAEFVRRRLCAEMKLAAGSCDRRRMMPKILTGAEVAFFDGMSRCEELELLCIKNTNAMLIEMPYCKWSQRMLNELREIHQFRRIRPVLAHIERFMAMQGRGLVEELVEQGMLIQVNTSFCLQWQTAHKAMHMLKQQNIHFVASDCHDMNHRPPDLGQAIHKIEEHLGESAIKTLKRNAERLLGE